jgi:hypothetical protein
MNPEFLRFLQIVAMVQYGHCNEDPRELTIDWKILPVGFQTGLYTYRFVGVDA